MKIEITHLINHDYPNKVEKTEKTWSVFGVVMFRKIYYYPKTESYNVINI